MKLIVLMAAITMVFYSCGNNSGRAGRTGAADGHTSEVALDWHGTYSGNLPCADCDRIETELTLNEDRTYVLITTYFKGEDISADTISGSFTWKGSNIRLEGIPDNERSPWYRVEEGQVRHLDMKGKVISGDLENYYILTKNGNPMVEDKRWQLAEIHGRPVEGTPETHFLIFNSGEGYATAKAGCNIMTYSYRIRDEYRISFGQGLSTLMACPDTLEDELAEVLAEADNLSTDGTYLSLNKARMAPLARFVLVPEEEE